jgi:integrating conjugative element protein (TIGR03759 family)
MFKKILQFGWFFSGIILLTNCLATDVEHTQIVKTQTAKTNSATLQTGFNTINTTNGVTSPVMSIDAFNALPKTRQKVLANIFGITIDEYKQYLHYMNDTIDGFQYQHNINPNFILAMHTNDKGKYRKYIKNTIKEDRETIGRLLQVNKDYTKMAKELYPNELPIMTPGANLSLAKGLREGDVLQLFCSLNDPVCANMVNIWLPSILKTNNTKLDIFAIGKVNQKSLINFAKRNHIPFLLLRRHGVEMPFNQGGAQ